MLPVFFIYVYKLLTNKVYTDHPILKLMNENSITRGHKLKLEKMAFKTTVRQKFFTNRIVEPWNKLPSNVIEAPSINAFKNRFDKLWGRMISMNTKGTEICKWQVC